MLCTIAKKHTLFGPEHKLAIVVRAKVLPTGTTKNMKRVIVGTGVK